MRKCFTLAGVFASLLLAYVPVAVAAMHGSDAPVRKTDAPLPSAKLPKLPPVCTVTGAATTKNGVATLGHCNDPIKGYRVYGAQFVYKNLTVVGRAGSACPVKYVNGSAGTKGLITIPYPGATVGYTITMYVKKTARHMASRQDYSAATRTFAGLKLPGNAGVCPGNPTFAGDPNSPNGAGHPGSPGNGFSCTLVGQLQITASAVKMPSSFDCSGNGTCTWKQTNGTYNRYGIMFYPGRFECTLGRLVGNPMIALDVKNANGSTCQLIVDGVTTLPLPEGWGGEVTAMALISSSYVDADPNFPRLTSGSVTGKGSFNLCSLIGQGGGF